MRIAAEFAGTRTLMRNRWQVREGEAPAEPCISGKMRERLGGSLALPTRDGTLASAATGRRVDSPAKCAVVRSGTTRYLLPPIISMIESIMALLPA